MTTRPKVRPRWLVVAGAIAIQVALGSIYAWSAFTKPLQSEAFGYSRTETQAIFSAGLASFGIVMIIAGRLQQRYPARNIALIGGGLLGLGYILGSFGDSFVFKLVTIGIIGGAGIGFAYVVPIAVGVKWFPDRKGLLTGLAVAGFGFGAFIWILMASPTSLIADTIGFDGLIHSTTTVVGMEEVTVYDADNVNQVFMLYGVLFTILVTLGALVMVPPPEGWLPEGWTPPVPAGGSSSSAAPEFESREMLRTPQFYMLWSMFVIGALAGLMVIGNIKNFAQDPDDGFSSNAADIAIIGAAICLPIFNGLGRIAWGSLSDRLGRQRAFVGMFSAQAVMMFIFFWSTSNAYLFYLVVALIGFNFGGNFALFPAATADYFGSRNIGANYGLVFTSYAAGGLIGPILAGMVKDGGYPYTYAFIPAALLCLVAAGLALRLRSPVTHRASAALAGAATPAASSVPSPIARAGNVGHAARPR